MMACVGFILVCLILFLLMVLLLTFCSLHLLLLRAISFLFSPWNFVRRLVNGAGEHLLLCFFVYYSL